MARKNVELLLNRSVENLGIVGDVVKVKPGFARNYLLPHGLAEHPTPEKIEALKEARAAAQAEVSKLRSDRESLVGRMENLTIKLIRSCNDQGVLYGAVSQRDIADQLVADGYGVDTRAVRLSAPFRRIGTYHCIIQFERDLKTEITVEVLPDRAIEAFTQTQAAASEPEAEAAEGEEGETPAGAAEGGEAKAGKPRAPKGEGKNKAEAGKGESRSDSKAEAPREAKPSREKKAKA